ncbi:MAG TPA: alpha-galactosidase [Puia sp.]|nr:alpha-galactosidase [Puia sp.]
MKIRVLLLSACLVLARMAPAQEIRTSLFSIQLGSGQWTYRTVMGKQMVFELPRFNIDGKGLKVTVGGWVAGSVKSLSNGTREEVFTGVPGEDATIRLAVSFRWAVDNPIVRFRYTLSSTVPHRFTKPAGIDDLQYYSVSVAGRNRFKEVRLSDFDEKYHSNILEEAVFGGKEFDDSARLMGPMLETGDGQSTFILAYEHGSQFPDRFLEFRLKPDRSIALAAVKGNYLNGQPLDGDHDYESIWFEVGGVAGGDEKLASAYRTFILKYITLNLDSRKPYIYYNTWGRQERAKWAGGSYLSTENLATTLKEIEVAHRMGVDVYVLDAGWFSKTGDWRVNTGPAFFPDTLKQVKALLDKYGMRLGVWIGPTSAAVSSEMLKRNKDYIMELHGKKSEPGPIWETENSVNLDLVSPYWSALADELIRLTREMGVSYFTFDAVDQYACDGANGSHGTEANSPQERADSYAFQLPIYLSKVVDKVCAAAPGTIFELDVTEEGRSMGLGFLSSGKYIILNNGAYFHNFDIVPPWQTPLANGNVQIFTNPGPARGWFTRRVLTYDKWLPSVLLLTYYQTDGSRNSQLINVASLILGQNGVWGNILDNSPGDVQFIYSILERYKQVRDDVTLSDPVREGEPGNSSEVVEKINAGNGRGEVVLFSNGGHSRYITEHRVDPRIWCTEGVEVHLDKAGRAVIDANFEGSGARIVFFGVK